MKDKIIIALDISVEKAIKIVEDLEGLITFYKVSDTILLQKGGWELINDLSKIARIFYDVKRSDTYDTGVRWIRHVNDVGATFTTIYNNSMLKACMDARLDCKMLFVPTLTDSYSDQMGKYAPDWMDCDGFILPVSVAKYWRIGTKKLIVSPGIRLLGQDRDNHKEASTPIEAFNAGVNYIVIGRPVYTAVSPKDVIKEILNVDSQCSY